MSAIVRLQVTIDVTIESFDKNLDAYNLHRTLSQEAYDNLHNALVGHNIKIVDGSDVKAITFKGGA